MIQEIELEEEYQKERKYLKDLNIDDPILAARMYEYEHAEDSQKYGSEMIQEMMVDAYFDLFTNHEETGSAEKGSTEQNTDETDIDVSDTKEKEDGLEEI